jgi:GMP synthase-like glutamine amidotransferase
MRVHLLDFNGGVTNRGTPALLALLAGARRWRTREAAELPPVDDGVWVLTGGPGSPLEEGAWRAPVLDALRARVAADAPTLAICYGMELVAAAVGATVAPLERPRVGIVPLRLTGTGREDALLGGLDGAPTFENRSWGVYGGPGATLAEGEEGDRVAVRFGERVVGVMFHPEADEAGARAALELGIPGDPAGLDRVHRRVVPGFVRASVAS